MVRQRLGSGDEGGIARAGSAVGVEEDVVIVVRGVAKGFRQQQCDCAAEAVAADDDFLSDIKSE